MKKLTRTVALLFTVVLISTAFTSKSDGDVILKNQDTDKIEIKGDVKEIIENKCTGCHKPDARNEKARKKLQWVKVPDMNKEEQEHLIDELFEVLEDGKMPPARMVERFPKMKLTEEETKTLMTWVEKEEKRLKGK